MCLSRQPAMNITFCKLNSVSLSCARADELAKLQIGEFTGQLRGAGSSVRGKQHSVRMWGKA